MHALSRAAAAAKSLQSCPTLCALIDGSPPDSAIPGILQARTLEWVAISFSNAWKWKVKVKSLSHVRLLVTPWTVAHQAPLSMGFSRQEYWSGVPLPSLCQELAWVLFKECTAAGDICSDRYERHCLKLSLLETILCQDSSLIPWLIIPEAVWLCPMRLLHWVQDPWFMRGAWQIDANVAVISLATCKQQNCKCRLLLWQTPKTGLHRCLRRPKQGCPWPVVLAQRAPDPSQLPPYRRGQFLTYIQDTITLKSTSWKTLYFVSHFMNEEAILRIKELIFPFPKLRANMADSEPKEKRNWMQISWIRGR